tara:strand:- start:8096 stop:8818 length:723 start_codon:yes stop_codon:yes gene_type:complete
MKLVIVTTAYNCEDYIKQCIVSIKAQSHRDFVCYITDDLSTDKTLEVAKEAVGSDERFVIISNKEKLYQPGNYDNVIRNNSNISDDDIVVEVDGDDWLPDNKVFDRVVSYYADGNTWITYGQFRYSNGRAGFAKEVDINTIRGSVFTASHLRTWKAFLWRSIPQELLKVNGYYAHSAGDIYFMVPMLERATVKHTKFITDVNYIYNEDNPLNDHKGERASEQVKLAIIGRSRKPLLPLIR